MGLPPDVFPERMFHQASGAETRPGVEKRSATSSNVPDRIATSDNRFALASNHTG
jgi:hypothetical protein